MLKYRAEIQTVEKRVTSRYIDRYSHLDSWGPEFVRLKVLKPYRKTSTDESWDGEGNTIGKVIVTYNPYKLSVLEIRSMLYQHFTYSGCTHSYDCCGCMSTYASVKPIHGHNGREFRVELSYRRNY